MAWAKVGSTAVTAIASGGGTVNPSYPQSPTANNLLILTVEVSAFGSIPTCTTPTGWTQVGVGHTQSSGSEVVIVWMFFKKATGGDAVPTVTLANCRAGAALVEEWSGGDGTLRTSADSSSASGTPSTVSATVTGGGMVAGDLVFAAVGARGSGYSGSWGGSATVDTAAGTSGAGDGVGYTTGTLVATGTSATPSFTASSGSNTSGLNIKVAVFTQGVAALTITPTGIPSAEALGNATITGGGVALVITPTGIPSAEALGNATIAAVLEGHVYTHYALAALKGQINLATATVKAIALTAYAIGTTRETAQFVSDIRAVATESAGGTYPAGGVPVTGLTFTEVGDTYVVACNPIAFSTTDIAMAYVLFAVTDPGSDATDPVILWWNLGGTKMLAGITPDPAGWLVANAL